MVRKIIFENEITLWWELQKGVRFYDVYLNGSKFFRVDSTHVTLSDLLSKTEYLVKIVTDSGRVFFEEKICTQPKKNRIDVSKPPYNAVGDGKTVNTVTLQKAFDDCGEDDAVYFPQGVFLTGALRLHGNTQLFLEKGCVLQGTDNLQDYLPKIKSRFEGLEFECYSSLLNMGTLDSQGGCNCENIVIRGKGRIVGGGNPLREKVIAFENERLKEELNKLGDKIKEYETTDTIAGRFRGRLINVSNVNGFTICGVSIESSPAWNLHMVYSKNLTVYNCDVISHGISNGDGIDPDSVENCVIFGCNFDTSDDCIAIKSGRNPEGNVVNRKSSNIYIFDCVACGNGISIGSEMSGGVENVFIWDCDALKAYWGVQLKFSKKRGGFIKNVHVSRCKLSYFAVWNVPYNNEGEPAPTIPEVKDLFVEDCEIFRDENIYEDVSRYIFIRGINNEYPIKNVYLNNIVCKKKNDLDGAFVIENVENLTFNKLENQKI